MFQFIVNSLTLGGVIAITSLLTDVTKLSFLPTVLSRQAKNFNCVFYYKSYAIKLRKQADGFNIHCVKFNET